MSQIYETYWKITLALTDIYTEKFHNCLSIITHFIDKNSNLPFSSEKYNTLQDAIKDIYPIGEPSIRKLINEYVKLGFVNFELISYHEDVPTFLKETNKEKKKTIFSKIVYSNSSFDRSVTNASQKKEINFLIKTLGEVKKLDKTDILALMTKDITIIPKGYLTRDELDQAKKYTEAIGFLSRKYNQLGHLWSILDNLDNLVRTKDELYLEEDAIILGRDTQEVSKKRDPYLQIIYKNQLKEESTERFGNIQCMIEKLDYPSLVASHIKPFVHASENEAYDVNNGLLLSRNMDFLFDRGYISFTEDGQILLSNKLSQNLKKYLKNYSLDQILINGKRNVYLHYHRNNIFI